MVSRKNILQTVFNHNLARDSAIIFIGSMVSNVVSYIFHLVMGRMLGPDGYGELSALYSLLYLFTVPLGVGQTVLVKFVSEMKAKNDTGEAKSLFWKSTRICLILSLLGLPFAVMLAPLVMNFLQIQVSILFILVYILFIFSLLTMFIVSLLQGYQKFLWLSILGSLVIILKLVFSIVGVRWGLVGVMTGSLVASIIAYILYFFPLRSMLRITSKPIKITWREALGYAVPTFFALLGLTSLYSTDILFVKHFFSASQAGVYAALAILGKVIFYASSAIGLVLFPVLSERVAKKEQTKKLVYTGVAAVSVVSIFITGLYFLFPQTVIHLLFGNTYVGAVPLLGMFGIFLSLFSVGSILTIVNLALGNTGVWTVTLCSALLQIIGIIVFHDQIMTVIFVNIIVSSILTIGAGSYYFFRKNT